MERAKRQRDGETAKKEIKTEYKDEYRDEYTGLSRHIGVEVAAWVHAALDK